MGIVDEVVVGQCVVDVVPHLGFTFLYHILDVRIGLVKLIDVERQERLSGPSAILGHDSGCARKD